MSNMTYCRFQNTLLDLRDCKGYLFDDDLSEDEKHAREQLIELCEEIIQIVEGDEDIQNFVQHTHKVTV